MPAPSGGATWVANGLATATRRNEKNTETPAKTGTTHTTRLRAQLRLSRTADGAEGREHQEPEEERSLLSAPERGDRVRGGQRLARRSRDVREREVVPEERREQDTGSDERREERGYERVLRGERQAAPPEPRRGDPGDERVYGETERDDEGGATQLGHGCRVRRRSRRSSARTSTGTS